MEQELKLRRDNWLALYQKIDEIFFPELPNDKRPMSWWQYLFFVAVGVAIFSLAGSPDHDQTAGGLPGLLGP
jgi:hypothetical protein